MPAKSPQLELTPRRPNLDHPGWGGPGRGGGRPRSRTRGVSHERRPKLAARHPVHVTLRLQRDVGNLRNKPRLKVLRRAFRDSAERPDFRLVHFSVQRDHIHLIVEATHESALWRGVSGLEIRVAKRLNKLLGRRGRVFADRYHAHILATPAEVKAALKYVLLNARKHWPRDREAPPADMVDRYSSGIYFDGWDRRVRLSEPHDDNLVPTASPRTWLLRVGWMRYGPISPSAVPGE